MNYISLRQIADDINDHPLLRDVTFERIINYALHLIRIVGMPKMFENKIAKLKIKDYRATLPCDFLDIIQVENSEGVCYRSTTDSFHLDFNNRKETNKCCTSITSGDLTYKIQGNFIYTSNKEGEITISYQALAVDSEGYPLIPDNSSFIEALEAYIKKKRFTILFDQGKITPQVYNQACQDYAWYVGQAQSDFVRPTIDEMQSITNMFNTLIARVSDHRNGFKDAGNKEFIKVQ